MLAVSSWVGMMGAEWATVLVPLILFLATIIRSSFGFGEALVAVPLLALVTPVEIAVPVAVLASITVALIAVVQDWHLIHFRDASRLVLSTVVGIPIGLWLLKVVPEPIIKGVLAVIIIAFSTYSLLSRRQQELKTDRSVWLFGFTAGILGGAYGVNGPPWSSMVHFAGGHLNNSGPRCPGILSSCQRAWNVWFLDCGHLDAHREPVLSTVARAGHCSYISGKSDQSKHQRASVCCLRAPGTHRYWDYIDDASDSRKTTLIGPAALALLLEGTSVYDTSGR